MALKQEEQVRSIRLVKSEQLKLSRAVIALGTISLKLCTHMMADYALYWMLTVIRYHSRFQSSVKAPNMVGVHIEGEGFIANLLKSIVKAFQPLGIHLEIDTIPCLPDPIPPDYDRYVQIAVILLLCWLLTIFEPYGLRLRHSVMCYYHPTRARQRAIWLYNHILRSRSTFLKFARRQLRRKVLGTQGITKVTFKEYIQSKIKFKWLLMCLGSEKQDACLLCAEVFRESDPIKPIRCKTPGCLGIYCERCFDDLQNICTVCLSPIQYGDLSDISEEKDSSEDELPITLKKKKKKCAISKCLKKQSESDSDNENLLKEPPKETEESEDDSDYNSSETDNSYGYQEHKDISSDITELPTPKFKDAEEQKRPDYASWDVFKDEYGVAFRPDNLNQVDESSSLLSELQSSPYKRPINVPVSLNESDEDKPARLSSPLTSDISVSASLPLALCKCGRYKPTKLFAPYTSDASVSVDFSYVRCPKCNKIEKIQTIAETIPVEDFIDDVSKSIKTDASISVDIPYCRCPKCCQIKPLPPVPPLNLSSLASSNITISKYYNSTTKQFPETIKYGEVCETPSPTSVSKSSTSLISTCIYEDLKARKTMESKNICRESSSPTQPNSSFVSSYIYEDTKAHQNIICDEVYECPNSTNIREYSSSLISSFIYEHQKLQQTISYQKTLEPPNLNQSNSSLISSYIYKGPEVRHTPSNNEFNVFKPTSMISVENVKQKENNEDEDNSTKHLLQNFQTFQTSGLNYESTIHTYYVTINKRQFQENPKCPTKKQENIFTNFVRKILGKGEAEISEPSTSKFASSKISDQASGNLGNLSRNSQSETNPGFSERFSPGVLTTIDSKTLKLMGSNSSQIKGIIHNVGAATKALCNTVSNPGMISTPESTLTDLNRDNGCPSTDTSLTNVDIFFADRKAAVAYRKKRRSIKRRRFARKEMPVSGSDESYKLRYSREPAEKDQDPLARQSSQRIFDAANNPQYNTSGELIKEQEAPNCDNNSPHRVRNAGTNNSVKLISNEELLAAINRYANRNKRINESGDFIREPNENAESKKDSSCPRLVPNQSPPRKTKQCLEKFLKRRSSPRGSLKSPGGSPRASLKKSNKSLRGNSHTGSPKGSLGLKEAPTISLQGFPRTSGRQALKSPNNSPRRSLESPTNAGKESKISNLPDTSQDNCSPETQQKDKTMHRHCIENIRGYTHGPYCQCQCTHSYNSQPRQPHRGRCASEERCKRCPTVRFPSHGEARSCNTKALHHPDFSGQPYQYYESCSPGSDDEANISSEADYSELYQDSENYCHLVNELGDTPLDKNRDRVRKAMREFEEKSRQNKNLDKPVFDSDTDDQDYFRANCSQTPVCDCDNEECPRIRANAKKEKSYIRVSKPGYVEHIVNRLDIEPSEKHCTCNTCTKNCRTSHWEHDERTGEWYKAYDDCYRCDPRDYCMQQPIVEPYACTQRSRKTCSNSSSERRHSKSHPSHTSSNCNSRNCRCCSSYNY